MEKARFRFTLTDVRTVFVGVFLEGIVLDVAKTEGRLHLAIDANQSKGDSDFHWSPGLGDAVHLSFPNREEKSRLDYHFYTSEHTGDKKPFTRNVIYHFFIFFSCFPNNSNKCFTRWRQHFIHSNLIQLGI